MIGKKDLSIVLIVAPCLVLLLLLAGLGCKAITGPRPVHDPNRPPEVTAQEPGLAPEDREGPAASPTDRASAPLDKTEPPAKVQKQESVAPALPTGPACSLWGRVAPRAAYRQALNEAKARYQRERKEARQNADPCGPLTAAEAKLRCTRTVEAARYTYRNADLLQQLPEDQTRPFIVKEIQISGNTQITSDDLLFGLPAVYVESRPLKAGEPKSNLVYDFRTLAEIVLAPGRGLEVSQRTIQGLTKYILGQYKKAGYVGIYVYVSASAVDKEARLVDGILPLRIIEAQVAQVTTKWRDFQGREKQDHVLKEGFIEAGSPVQEGQVIQKNDLDEYIRLLNANPDRRVAAVVSPGREPNAIDLSYDVYERNPWHFYTQLDNSGIDRRQWNPRVGLLNTNLTGHDDRLSAMIQTDVDSPGSNYAVLGAYDFPLVPRFRLGFYGGTGEFDITPEAAATSSSISFLGDGWFTGMTGRYNVAQAYDWLFDLTGSLSREVSRVDRSPGTDSDVEMTLGGLGFEAHRRREALTGEIVKETSVFFERLQNFSGDSADFENARRGANPQFVKWSLGAAHWQFLDAKQVHQVSARFRDILPDGRLVPAKMTTFGGLYSVRGYPEDLLVADGGILASVEYRFYLSKCLGIDAQAVNKMEVSLVGFTDYGRPTIQDPTVGEFRALDMWGMGVGTILEVKPNFLAGIYYGWALREVRSPSNNRIILTGEGDGQWNFNFVYRF
jgi:hemolysin activation/secretion protein